MTRIALGQTHLNLSASEMQNRRPVMLKPGVKRAARSPRKMVKFKSLQPCKGETNLNIRCATMLANDCDIRVPPLQGLVDLWGWFTRASARRTRSSPGCHIEGFQPCGISDKLVRK